MTTSRRVRRRNQSAERRARHAAQKHAAEWALASEERATRLTEALTAANAMIAVEFPDLHGEGLRLDWADDEDADV
jgi:hypothetical protein